VTAAEQGKLRQCRIAIAGMGGVGGVHLVTLARLGIGSFTIADPDRFEVANFNRQYGATIPSLGRLKVEVMAEAVRAINPEAEVRTFAAPIGRENLSDFLDGANVFVDGIDFFALDARRLIFGEARKRGLWSITAGPHAFSAAWLLFSPDGMSFDEFFDFHDGMGEEDKLVAFAVGTVPKPIHLAYLDFAKYFSPGSRKGASLGVACQIASGIVGTQVAKILLGRPGLRPAPWYFQFDAYREMLVKGKLRGGNRHPWQRLKRWWLKRRMLAQKTKGGGSDR
jgi:molybdopterin/thiamine biosynthesis adenylyltransferase